MNRGDYQEHHPFNVQRRVPPLLWVISVVVCALIGCSENDQEAMYERYLNRLQHALDVETNSAAPPPFPRPPRSGALQRAIETRTINALDFLALSGCALQTNIGRRNSSLGRMAKPSQQLLLDLEFLNLAPACVKQLEDNNKSTLATNLKAAHREKQDQLPARIFNATLASEEYRAFWQANHKPGTYPRVHADAALLALEKINGHVAQWLAGNYQVEHRDFELLLSDVAGGDGGALIKALQTDGRAMTSANAVLETRLRRGPLCGASLRQDAADVLPRVVGKFFIAEIQPRAARLNRRKYSVHAAVTQLEEQLHWALPKAYRVWQTQRDHAMQASTRATLRHVELLQQLLQNCHSEF